jgi:RimJ/RimL family protein N-acetyltransferase
MISARRYAQRRGLGHHERVVLQTPSEVLTGDGVTLRRWRIEDAPLVHRAVNESLDHLAPWMPFAVGGYTLADGETFLASCVEDWDQGRNFNYAIVSPDGNLAGSCGLMSRPENGFEIGYWLHVAYTGQGLATRAAAALVAEAWRVGAAYVMIRHDEANVRSRAIPERLGFTFLERRTPVVEKLTPARAGVELVWRLERPAE